MSIWYRAKSDKQINNLIKKLKKCGYTESKFGCPKEDAIGIALYEDEMLFIYLNEEMCSLDPYTSWVLQRKEVYTEKEFIDYIENKS